MSVLIAGLVLFCLIHLLPVFRSLRAILVNSLEAGVYKSTFSLLSAASIGLMIYGKWSAGFEPLYEPPVWGRHAAWLCLLIAFILMASTHGPSALRNVFKHPMLAGMVFWGGGHLLANGDMASVILFGGLAGFSLAMITLVLMRDGVKRGGKYNWRSTFIQSGVGVLVYLGVLFLHPLLFGVSPL